MGVYIEGVCECVCACVYVCVLTSMTLFLYGFVCLSFYSFQRYADKQDPSIHP